jgi:hypothetical protein
MTLTLSAITAADVLEIAALADQALRQESEMHGLEGGLAEFRGTSLRSRLRHMIAALTAEACHELMAVMWIGRGDQHTFADAVAYARYTSDDGDAIYMAGRASLGRYLRAGLTRLTAIQQR